MNAKSKYLAGLIAANVVLAALAIGALMLFATHTQLRRSIGHDESSYNRFVARVDSGSLRPETLARFTNDWFAGFKQNHRIIQMEEKLSDRLARRSLVLGSLGLSAALFQAWMILALWKNLRMPKLP